MIPPPEVKELNFQDFVRIFLKRAWIPLVFLIAGILLVSLQEFLSPKIYIAKTKVQLETSPLKLVDPQKGPIAKKSQWQWRQADYQTQLELLRSQPVAERVIKKLGLSISSEKLLSMVKVELIRDTHVAVIAVRGRDPGQICNIANAWPQEAIQQDLDESRDMAQYGVGKLEKQLTDTLEKLKESEKELSEFLRDHRDLAEQEELVERLRSQKLSLEEEIVEKSTQYGERHHKIAGLRDQLEQVNERLKEETAKYLETEDSTAMYNVLKKKSETYREIYEDLILRSKQLGTVTGLAVANIKIIDAARVPAKPERRPFKKKILVIIALMSLGFFLCFFLEIIDTTIHTSDDVEFFVKLPFFGYIPHARKSKKDRCLISQKEPYSTIAEAFRNVKIALLFAPTENKTLKKIMVTSSVPGEGKSFIVCNLATIFAEGGHSTLLIDADMRKGGLAGIFDIKDKPGLSDMLSGKASLEKIITNTKVPNLSIIPAGALIPNPTDVLDSDNFAKLFQSIEKKFDKIILDVPPPGIFSDCMFWESKSDVALLVIRAGKTKLHEVNKALEKITPNIKLKGGVLNDAEIERDLNYYLHHFEAVMKKRAKSKK